jgi:hypothetical protein
MAYRPNSTEVRVTEYRQLGRTALKVSILGFGGSPLGDVFGTADRAEGVRAVHLAIDKGINFFDVASNLHALRIVTDRDLLQEVRALLHPVLSDIWSSGRPENHDATH